MIQRWPIEIFLLALFGALLGYMFIEALQLSARARMFPLLVFGPSLLLVAIRVGVILTRVVRHVEEAYGLQPEFKEDFWSPTALRRALRLLAWMVFFSVALWLLGLIVGLTISLTLYVKVESGDGFVRSVMIGLGMLVFLVLVLVVGVGIGWRGGVLIG